jgi:hypothetical protein
LRVSFDVGLYPKIPTEEGFGVKLPSHSSPSSRPWPTTGAQFGRCLLEFGSAVSGAERKKMWQELVGMRHGVKGDFNTGFQDICGNILRILRICSAHAVKGVNIQHRYCLIFGYLTALTVSRDLTPCNINSDASGLPLTHMSKTLPRFCCVYYVVPTRGQDSFATGQANSTIAAALNQTVYNILLLISRFYVDLIH